MKFQGIVRNFLLLLFAAYFAQGWLYGSGGAVSQGCLAGIILISFIYAVKTLLLGDNDSPFFRAWTIFIVLNIVGFIINPDLSAGTPRETFKNIAGCMLPFYPFYYFARKNELKANHLVVFFLVMLPITIFQFFTYRNNVLLEAGSTDKDVVNNISYSFISLMPFVFLIKGRRLLSGAAMALLMLFIIQGAKRGAMIAGAIGMVIYFYFQLKTIEKEKRMQGYLVVFLIVAALSVFAWRTFMSNDFLLDRMNSMMEGDSSYRETLYTGIFSGWLDSDNFLNYLFGFGLTESLNLSRGDMAHSDWLQLLSSLGIAGIIAYVWLFLTAVKQSFKSEWLIDKRLLMLTITVLWFFISLISMGYTSMNYFSFSIIFGFLSGAAGPGLTIRTSAS